MMVHPEQSMDKGEKPVTIVNKLGLLTSMFGIVPIGLALSIGALMQIDQSEDKIGGKGLAISSVMLNLLWIIAFCFLGLVYLPMKRAEPYQKQVLGAESFMKTLVNSQREFKTKHGRYLSLRKTPHIEAREKPQEWDAKPCPASCLAGKHIDCTEFSCLNVKPPKDAARYQFACFAAANGQEFSCGAKADLDQDGVAGSFTYRSITPPATTSTLADALSQCAAGKPLPANQLYGCNGRNF
ncbi:MAG: hypothetical protein VYC39_02540 [Myxococcota bacterium]|nr:hypothetical protein [Myxococcota bacterium]